MALSPVLDYILVRKTEEALPSGLYMSAPADPTAPRHADVIAVGPGRPSEYSGSPIQYPVAGEVDRYYWPGVPVKVGDVVVMHGGAGTKVKVGTDELWAILPRDIIAVVTAA